ncbi:MAG: alpha/beta fold hydrolase [Holophagales bacterium]|nr:alpha/beta fold hydrolase [Holophagales bacterium]MBK9372160.1 alpha/beta fold hydrolase [Holophagales bacterium]
MPFADRGTHRLSYETLGREDAPTLLLVMGMSFSARAWGPLPERLAREFRVVVFDNRGSGESTAPLRPFGMSDLADDAAAVLEAAGAGPASVFGISMGGMIAIELALRHPDRVSALALGATFGGWRESRKASLQVMAELIAGGALSRMGSHRLIAGALVSKELAGSDLARFGAWVETTGRVGPRVLALQLAAVTAWDATPRLGEIRVPTLAITGDADQLVPVANSRRIVTAIPGARLVLLPGAGHCFPLERFEETARAVTAFFREAASRIP